MHRTDAINNVAGMFSEGDPSVPRGPTQGSPAWFNDVQENLCQAIVGAGIALVKGAGGQLLAAIRALVAERVRPGQYKEYAVYGAWDDAYEKPPENQMLNRADYPALWALVSAPANADRMAVDAADKLANPHNWGPGDGVTTFQMPDERGLFHRVDASGKVGSVAPIRGVLKPNQNAAHTHQFPVSNNDPNGVYVANAPDTSGGFVTTSPSGGDEANPDHIVTYYTIVLK